MEIKINKFNYKRLPYLAEITKRGEWKKVVIIPEENKNLFAKFTQIISYVYQLLR